MRSYTQIVAEELSCHGPYAEQIDEQFLDDLYRASPLHDIGKVGINDAILLKAAWLTPEEFETMKQHTTIGANILDNVAFAPPDASFLSMAATVARFHHERFDGRGYPAGFAARRFRCPRGSWRLPMRTMRSPPRNPTKPRDRRPARGISSDGIPAAISILSSWRPSCDASTRSRVFKGRVWTRIWNRPRSYSGTIPCSPAS